MTRIQAPDYDGEHGPDECGWCGATGITICCTELDYDDGSHDGAWCTDCCPAHSRGPRPTAKPRT